MNVVFAILNGPEIILILVLALVLFGSKKLPELARGLGQGLREFKKSTRDITDDLESAIDLNAPPPPARRLPQTPVQNAAPSQPSESQGQAPKA